MKKWFQKAAAVLITAAVLIGQSVAAAPVNAAAGQEESIKIATLSDTHYLSPDMIKDTADFTRHLNSDRKMFAESDAFLTALLNTIKEDKPDVLLIPGDLTKDGEKEGHEELAAKLEAFRDAELPNLHIYIAPGNHDLNNPNAMNFNTPDGIAVPAGRTTPQVYRDIYAELTYNDESVTATFEPADGNQGGGLSYAARPKDGFTFISIDSARYSADNTSSGADRQETGGAISAELENWVVEQTAMAKNRGDTVIGFQHHGLVPHFSMEPELLPDYLVNDYERLGKVFADAGMQYVFTGHMHANDIASVTTDAGNTLYDIETASVVTYPSPVRITTITRSAENGRVSENMEVKTISGAGPITFVNPVTEKEQTIEDISAYGREHGFSNEMLGTTLSGFLSGYTQGGSKEAVMGLLGSLLGDSLPGGGTLTMEELIEQALPALLSDGSDGGAIYYDAAKGGIYISYQVSIVNLNILIPNQGLIDTLNFLFEKLDDEVLQSPAALDSLITGLVAELTSIKLTGDGKTILDFANFIYQSHLAGKDSEEFPEWVAEITRDIESGETLAEVLKILVSYLSNLLTDETFKSVTFEELVGSAAMDRASYKFIPSEPGRTPLLELDTSKTSGATFGLFLLGIAHWESVANPAGGTMFVPPTNPQYLANPEKGYTVYDFVTLLFGIMDTDLESILSGLLLGTPADPETGEEASEGLLSGELQAQLQDLLLGVVNSMGKDSNFPQDNDAVITYEWLLRSRVQEDDANIKFSSGWNDRAAIGRFDEHVAKQASKLGESMSFTFEGNYFEFVSYKSYSQGMFDIYVDGVKTNADPIDLYEPGADSSFGQRVGGTAVPYGEHTVTLVIVGRNRKSVGNNVYIDAVNIAGEFVRSAALTDDQVIVRGTAPIEIDVLANDSATDAPALDTLPKSGSVEFKNGIFVFTPDEMSVKDDSFTYKVGNDTATVNLVYADTIRYEETFNAAAKGKQGTWNSFSFSRYSGGSAIRSGKAGDTVEITFYGTGIDIIGYKSWSRGKAEITLDGAVEMVDTHDRSYDKLFQSTIYSVSGLEAKAHTLKIKVTGQRNILATGSAVDIDAFVVSK